MKFDLKKSEQYRMMLIFFQMFETSSKKMLPNFFFVIIRNQSIQIIFTRILNYF